MLRRLADRAPHVVLALAAAAAVGVVYGDTGSAVLRWDDYLVLRPTSWADIARSFHAPWDPLGVMAAFYRPLAVAYFAGAFEVFGLNTVAHHAVSLVELTLAAWLLGLFVRREIGSVPLAAVAAVLYACHPWMAVTIGPWFSSQIHIVVTIMALVALLGWQRRRSTPTLARWWPLAVPITIGFLVKEDALLVAPALLALQLIRARTSHGVPRPPWSLVTGVLGWVAGLVVLRHVMLGEDAIGLPTVSEAALNLLRGPAFVLVRFHGMFFEETASIIAAGTFSVAAFTIGSACAWRAGSRVRDLWIVGAVLGFFVNLPLAVVSSNTRYYLLTLAAVIGMTAAIGGLAVVARRWRPLAVAVIAAGLVALPLAARDVIAPFQACGPSDLFADAEVLSTRPLPPAAREWMAAKPAACAAGRYRPLIDAVDSLVWNAESDRPTVMISRRARAVRLRVREARAASEWQEISVVLSPSLRTTLRGMYRIDIADLVPGGRGTLDPQSIQLQFTP